MRNKISSPLSEENRWALVIALVLILLTILSSNDAPLWIYQGF
jgi:hypothetical protein